MARFVVINARVVRGDRVLEHGAVEVLGSRIRKVGSARAVGKGKGKRVIDAGGKILAPGFIDLHIHGMSDYLVDDGPGSLAALCALLPHYGVTGFLPTLSPRPYDAHVALIRELSSLSAPGGAAILGLHLEGPYLTLAGALSGGGASPVRAEVETLVAAARPHRAVFSVSPELPGLLDVIDVMRADGAPVFMTHTAAGVAETRAAIEAGVRHATHFYDVFPCPVERDRGVRPCGAVEAVLADSRVSVDFILDGVHVEPAAVLAALAAKGPDGVCLITDAMAGAGLPPGRYTFGGQEIVFEREGGPARLGEKSPRAGGLAGSGLTMNRAVRNAVEMLEVDLSTAVRLASSSPARVLGLGGCKGRIDEGFDADMVLLDDDLTVLNTWVGGECVYAADEET
ncbi:MAG TPA: amidohydrolase family protein [Planctomycetota bacterium]|nr:amidohydrolase family protein [Planctomycetota bacterium]